MTLQFLTPDLNSTSAIDQLCDTRHRLQVLLISGLLWIVLSVCLPCRSRVPIPLPLVGVWLLPRRHASPSPCGPSGLSGTDSGGGLHSLEWQVAHQTPLCWPHLPWEGETPLGCNPDQRPPWDEQMERSGPFCSRAAPQRRCVSCHLYVMVSSSVNEDNLYLQRIQ